VVQTDKGKQQAREGGLKVKQTMEATGMKDYKLFFYTSPYRRSLQTFEGIRLLLSLAHRCKEHDNNVLVKIPARLGV
jgi:broad specificity phosphatase PhoE